MKSNQLIVQYFKASLQGRNEYHHRSGRLQLVFKLSGRSDEGA